MNQINKTAIVVGGSGGIGTAISKCLLDNSYDVHVANRVSCDIRNPIDVYSFVNRFSTIDVLINSAGVSGYSLIENIDEKQIEDIYQINVMGMVRFCKTVIPIMKKQNGGTIINIGSLRGIYPSKGKAAYAMSKAAVRIFSDILGLECAEYGIRVVCINPGFTYTKLIERRIANEGLSECDISTPMDIANAVMFVLGLSCGAKISEINIGEVWE